MRTISVLIVQIFNNSELSTRVWKLEADCCTGNSFVWTLYLDAVHRGVMNGHPGIEKTRSKLQEIAYWKGWTIDVLAYVQKCHICSVHRPGPCCKQGRMQWALARDVMRKVHVDLVWPFPLSRKGYCYLLTTICGFTKYWVRVPVCDKVSVTVADALIKHLYLVYGPLKYWYMTKGVNSGQMSWQVWQSC